MDRIDGILLFVMPFLIAFIVTLRLVILYYDFINDLLNKTPEGSSKEWIWTLPSGYGFAIVFTNTGNNKYKWHIGVFKVTNNKS